MIAKVDKLLIPMDFMIMNVEEDMEVPMILAKPFMETTRMGIDIDCRKMTL